MNATSEAMGRSSSVGVLQAKNGVLIADGYGVRVAVERRHLVVEDGICDERHHGRFGKTTAKLKRLVVLGHTGFITLEALRWLKDVGAAFVQIDADGQVIVASGPRGLDDARLRRAQALALSNGVGMKVAQELVRRKLEGQLALLVRLPGGDASASVIHQSLGGIDRTTTSAELRVLESAAAAAYWKTYEHIPVRFVRRDEPRVPNHWRVFGSRTSPLTGGSRLAGNPANAILNYLYAVLESETRIAALAVGLDPGIGVLHADQPARNSLSLDLMEPVRPEVDAYVLNMLQGIFRASDFFETRQGVCRVLPPLTQTLAGTATQWAKRIAPITEWAAQAFASRSGSRIRRVPTPLTQARRSAGRGRFKQSPSVKSEPPKPETVPACLLCGEVLHSSGRLYCDDCLPGINAKSLVALRTAGQAALAKLRSEGRDPAHAGAAARKRMASLDRRRHEAEEWERTNLRPDPAEFTRNILPRLKGVPIGRMARATGLSIRYCSLIRQGQYVPHPRHWSALKTLNQVE